MIHVSALCPVEAMLLWCFINFIKPKAHIYTINGCISCSLVHLWTRHFVFVIFIYSFFSKIFTSSTCILKSVRFSVVKTSFPHGLNQSISSPLQGWDFFTISPLSSSFLFFLILFLTLTNYLIASCFQAVSSDWINSDHRGPCLALTHKESLAQAWRGRPRDKFKRRSRSC